MNLELPLTLGMSENFLTYPGWGIQLSCFPALGDKGDALCQACPAAWALSLAAGGRAELEPSRGTTEVFALLSGSFEEVSAPQETQQPPCTAAIATVQLTELCFGVRE